MESNRDAPATAKGGLQIDADPQTVFAVLAGIGQWPWWNPDVRSVQLQGRVQPGTTFRWKAGPSWITATLQVVHRPRELAWRGRTMGSRAVQVFRLQPSQDGTLARSEGSWEGLPARLLNGYGRRTLDKGVRSVLAYLKAERRAASGGTVSGLRGVTLTVRFLCELAAAQAPAAGHLHHASSPAGG